jgi:hypothetical protein
MRLRPSDEADLRFRFFEADGALGLRSSFGPMVDSAMCGGAHGGGPGDPLSEAKVRAAEKCREVDARLVRIHRDHVRVLQRYVGRQVAPPVIRGKFGRLACLAVTIMAVDDLETACVTPSKASVVSSVRTRAEVLLSDAVAAYVGAR